MLQKLKIKEMDKIKVKVNKIMITIKKEHNKVQDNKVQDNKVKDNKEDNKVAVKADDYKEVQEVLDLKEVNPKALNKVHLDQDKANLKNLTQLNNTTEISKY